MNNLHLVPQQQCESTATAELPRLEPPLDRFDRVDGVGSDGVATAWWDGVAACAAVSPRGVFAFGTALRLHGLACFADYDELEVLCPKGWNPSYRADVRLRHTRGLTHDDVIIVSTPTGEVRVLDLATTLALLGSSFDEGSVNRAVGEALDRGLSVHRLRTVAQRWSARGRVGPPLCLRLVDDRLGRRLPERWFERVATVLADQIGVDRVERGHRAGGRLGRQAVELPVAVPSARVAVVERPGAPLQHQLRDRGWSVVNVGWRDIDRAELIAIRVAMAVAHSTRAAA